MALLHYLWSRVAASNATADAQINWAEGQAPSSVNDSARAMMASLAGYRDDIAGAIVTGGTSTAFTVTSYQVFDTLAHMSGQLIGFTPHVQNGANPTLNVDGLGAKPLRFYPTADMPSSSLIPGTPYIAIYNNSDAAFYLQGAFINPYNIPIGGGIDYWGTSTPNSAFAFPAGQAISRTTYANCFSVMGTTHGAGDGSTTFNLPDKTGRVSVMKEAAATRLTTAGGGVDGATMGAVGGAQNATILQANLPAVTLTTTIVDPGHSHTEQVANAAGASTSVKADVASGATGAVQATGTSTTGITASTALGGSGTAFKLTQPTIVCNYIIRII